MIKLLPDDVVNKIAAGEVIDRPASIVRELVDNAVDAGAKNIIVEIERGGQGLVRVIDDGAGMGRDDALLAFERHATSKVSAVEDLLTLTTRGFRGEALSSIASVAKVTLRTRREADATGQEISISAGVVQGIKECACAVGTDIQVRNLFFNIPARKKFLKSENVEGDRIRSWLNKTFLGSPEVSLSLHIDGRQDMRLNPAESVLARGHQMYRGSFVEVQGAGEGISIVGLIAHPGMAQNHVDSLVILVNGRAVFDRLIFRAVKEGFLSMLKTQETPLGFISVTVPPAAVDVNVHPQKSEVRFLSPGSVIGAVRNAVEKAVIRFKGPAQIFAESVAASRVPAQNPFVSSAPSFQGGLKFQARAGEPANNIAMKVQGNDLKFSSLRYIGTVLECFLVTEGNDDSVYIIDMHAAHERINYNKIRATLDSGSLQIQQLLLPLTVIMTPSLVGALRREEAVLNKIGFDIQYSSENSVTVLAAPAVLSLSRIEQAIKEIAAYEEEGGGETILKQRLDYVAARLACHASIRKGDEITHAEVYALFEALDSAEAGGACPHGRPVVAVFPRLQVEQWFGRDR
jgi:DNA mismatch repair protein MutL